MKQNLYNQSYFNTAVHIFIVKAQLENPQHDASFFGCQGRKIALKTQYSDAKYLRALPDQHRVNANGTSNDDGIQFEVEDLGALPKGARKIALKSIYGKYLTAKRPAMGPLESYPVSNVTAHSTWLWKGAIFEVKHNANNLYWFKTAWKVESHGRNESRYLLPYTNGYIRGDGTVHDLRRWAKFTPECVEGIYHFSIKSVVNTGICPSNIFVKYAPIPT